MTPLAGCSSGATVALKRIFQYRVIVARATGLNKGFDVGIPNFHTTVNPDEFRTREACVTMNRRGNSGNPNKFFWIPSSNLDSEEEVERFGQVMRAVRPASVDTIQKDCKLIALREREQVLSVGDEGIRIESSDF